MLQNLFRGLLGGHSPLGTDSGVKKRKGQAHRPLRFEGVEDRRLLAVGVAYNAALDDLTLTGSTSADDVTVVGRATYIDIFVGGTFQERIQGAGSGDVNTIIFTGGASTDSLTVQNIRPAALAIDLTNVENLSVVKGIATTVTSNAGLNFGTSSFAGALTVTAAGDLTQTGAISVTGVTTLIVTGADSDITLSNAANNFTTVDVDADAAAGEDVTITDVNGIVFAESQVIGNLTVKANQNSTNRTAISQSGVLTVTGTTELTVGSASTITLNTAGNSFTGTVTIPAARTATLRNNAATGTDFGVSNVTQDLTVYDTNAASDGISQSGRLVVGRVASFNASAGDILLENDDNNFGTVSLDADTAAGQDASVTDSSALILGTVSVGSLANPGTLTVATNGAITQSGTITVPNGLTSLNAGEVNDITLTKFTNNFSAVQVLDVDNTASGARNVAIRDSGIAGLVFDDESIISGTLAVTAAGPITQTVDGDLTVAGKTTLAATSAFDITLSNPANDFSEVAVTSAQDVDLEDANELILGTSKISATLAVETAGTAAGDLTQSGQVVVTGATTLVANAGNITLDNANNNFSSVGVTANSFAGQNVSLRDTNAMTLAAFGITGDLVLQANLNASNRVALSQTGAMDVGGTTTLTVGSASTITLDNALNTLAGAISVTAAKNATLVNDAGTGTNLGACNVTGDMSVNSTADGITDSGTLVVGKTATFTANAGAANVVLDDDLNNFRTVIVNANDVTLVDMNALILGAPPLGVFDVNGNLTITTEGAITQSGALDIEGDTSLTAGQVGAAYDITLLNAVNDFGADPTTPNSLSIGYAGNVAIRDGVNSGVNDGLDLGASTIAGTLAVTTAGAITDSGALEVAGKATLTAGAANNITLDVATNNFSEVAVVSGDVVAITNDEALILGSSKVTTSLTVTTSNDSVTQSTGGIVAPTLTVVAGTGDVTLTNAGNNFGTAAVTTGNNVSIRDINALELDTSTLTGTLNVTAGGAISQAVGSTLNVTGVATLATNATADITLTEATNLFSEVAVTSGNNVSLTDANALSLGASNISGPLTVTTVGALTQSGAVVVAGLTTLDVGGANNITLDNADNNFATVQVNTGNNTTLVDTDDIVLGDVDVEGDLAVTADGSITDNGTIVVGTAIADRESTTLIADADGDDVGDILLDDGDAALYGTIALQGFNVEVTNSGADLTILGNCTAKGDLTVYSTGGDLTNDVDGAPGGTARGVLTVTGTAKLHAIANDAIFYQLGTPDNSTAGFWDVLGDTGTLFDTTTLP